MYLCIDFVTCFQALKACKTKVLEVKPVLRIKDKIESGPQRA